MNRKQRRAAAKGGGYRSPASLPDSSQTSPIDLFNTAIDYQRIGRFTEAERLCFQLLSMDPRHSYGLHLLGLLAHQRGRPDEAISRIRQAVAINHRVPEFHHDLGSV